MSENQTEQTTVAAASNERNKGLKKRTAAPVKTKKSAVHPKYFDMIKEALGILKERGGSSRQAILKYIMSTYSLGNDEKIINAHLKVALKSGVKTGTLKQSKGVGASGSFKLGNEKEVKEAKPKKVADKAPKAKSVAVRPIPKRTKQAIEAVKKPVKKPAAKAEVETKAKKPKASPKKAKPPTKTKAVVPAAKSKSPKKEVKKASPKPKKVKASASPKTTKKVKPAAKPKKATKAGKK